MGQIAVKFCTCHVSCAVVAFGGWKIHIFINLQSPWKIISEFHLPNYSKFRRIGQWNFDDVCPLSAIRLTPSRTLSRLTSSSGRHVTGWRGVTRGHDAVDAHVIDGKRTCGHRRVVGLNVSSHHDVMPWKHFPRNGPFVRYIHADSPNKGLVLWRCFLCCLPEQVFEETVEAMALMCRPRQCAQATVLANLTVQMSFLLYPENEVKIATHNKMWRKKCRAW